MRPPTNQPMTHSLSQAVWVHRLQPPEPASKDAVFKPGASTWNTDDPKQQHHAPGMRFWLAAWHASLACSMACNSGWQHGLHVCLQLRMQLWLATWHASLACSMACNSGLQHGVQHGVQLWFATWHAACDISACMLQARSINVDTVLACNMHAAYTLAYTRLQS